MNLSCLEEEYIDLQTKFRKLDTEINMIRDLVLGVEYSDKQQNSLLNVANRKVDKLIVLDEEIYAIEQMLEVYRINERMDSDSTVH